RVSGLKGLDHGVGRAGRDGILLEYRLLDLDRPVAGTARLVHVLDDLLGQCDLLRRSRNRHRVGLRIHDDCDRLHANRRPAATRGPAPGAARPAPATGGGIVIPAATKPAATAEAVETAAAESILELRGNATARTRDTADGGRRVLVRKQRLELLGCVGGFLVN